MNDTFRSSQAFQRLRERAEQLIQDKGVEIGAAERDDVMRLVHELEVQSIELEIQNEELRQSKVAVEASREEFFELWNSSPVAYVTLDSKGSIQRCNEAALELFEEGNPLNSPFLIWVYSDDVHLWYSFMEDLTFLGKKGNVELRLRGGEHPVVVHMEGRSHINEHAKVEWLLALVNVTERRHAEQALKKSEEWLRLAVNSGKIGTWDLDAQSQNVIWNETMFELLGRDPEGPPPTGETFFEYIHDDDLPRVQAHLAEAFRSGGEFVEEFRIIREDGELRWLAAYADVSRNQAGEPVKMAGVNYDITPRKHLEEELRESNERFRLAIRAAQTGVWERFPQSGKARWDRRMFELYGLDPDGLAPGTEDFYKFIHKDDLPRVRAGLEEALCSRTSFEQEFRIIREDGEVRWVTSLGSPVSEGQGMPERMIGISLDITERKQAEKILEESRDQLERMVQERTRELERRQRELQRMNRQLGTEVEKRRKFEAVLKVQGKSLTESYRQRELLSRKLVDLLENERRQIGCTLHDEIGQVLTGASLRLEGLRKGRNPEDTDLARQLETVQGLIRNAIKRTRDLAYNLRSDALERFGLIPAIRELVEEMKGHFEKGIHLFVKNIPEQFEDDNFELMIYRVIQESLTNVVKHAGATDVFISINGRDNVILLSVEDNGVGFDYGKLVAGSGSGQGSIGLVIMRERVTQLGGKFYVESRPGWGTHIFAEIPI